MSSCMLLLTNSISQRVFLAVCGNISSYCNRSGETSPVQQMPAPAAQIGMYPPLTITRCDILCTRLIHEQWSLGGRETVCRHVLSSELLVLRFGPGALIARKRGPFVATARLSPLGWPRAQAQPSALREVSAKEQTSRRIPGAAAVS